MVIYTIKHNDAWKYLCHAILIWNIIPAISLHICVHEKFINCDWACKNRPSEYKNPRFFLSLLYHNYLYYHNNIFTTTAAFNGLSSAVYGNGILHSEWKILATIYIAQCNLYSHVWFLQAQSQLCLHTYIQNVYHNSNCLYIYL